jgi:hypothetical protein
MQQIVIEQPSRVVSGFGIAGIKTNLLTQSTYASTTIDDAFNDLDSLRKKSRELARLAEKMK